MTKPKIISDEDAAKLCRKWIDKAIKKGVVLRPGSYERFTELTEDYKHKRRTPVLYACALGSIEHALHRGKPVPGVWDGKETLVKHADHGITYGQFEALEDGFENYNTHLSNPLVRLGQEMRALAFKTLIKREPKHKETWAQALSYVSGRLAEFRKTHQRGAV